MTPRLLDYLGHIETGIHVAIEALVGIDQDAFVNELADARTRTSAYAVRAAISQIGEATDLIMKRFPLLVDAHPEIPWSAMKGMRNLVVHEYFQLDYQVIWDTVQSSLPTLLAQLALVLRTAERLEPR